MKNVIVNPLKTQSRATIFCRCANGTVRDGPTLREPSLKVSKDINNAFLTYGDGYNLEPYAHEVNGVRQPGVYIGAQNKTTWGFRLKNPDPCGEGYFYEMKLQGSPLDPNTPPAAGSPPEFFGFLKAVPF
jgi:hypothetical protein